MVWVGNVLTPAIRSHLVTLGLSCAFGVKHGEVEFINCPEFTDSYMYIHYRACRVNIVFSTSNCQVTNGPQRLFLDGTPNLQGKSHGVK